MRLALLCTDRGVPYGATKGASLHLRELARALAGEGANVLLLAAAATRGAPPPPRTWVEVVPGLGKETSVEGRLAAADFLEEWLVRRLSALGVNAVYERLALHSAAGSRAARRLGIPHLVEVNAPLPWEAARYRRLEAPERANELEREVLELADVVFPVSGPLRDYVLARGARRVELLPNAVDPERFPLRCSRPQAPTAVFAGALRPWHGLETIAEAWDRLGRGAPRLVLIGEGRGRDVPIPRGAEVVGPVPYEEVPRILARATIGLAPYAKESPGYFSPLKLFEYLAARLAIVAGAIPGVMEAVTARETILIPPGDPVALADAVAALAADPDRCALLGARGRALVERRHTWRHRARQVLAVASSLAPEVALP